MSRRTPKSRIAILSLFAGVALFACGSGAEKNGVGADAEPLDGADEVVVEEPQSEPAPADDPTPGLPPASASDADLLAFFAELPGAALPEGCEVHETESGLRYAVVKPGEGGEACYGNDTVAVNYTGYFKDGKIFDQTKPQTGPARFPVGGVIPGWTEALMMMTPGQKMKVFIPWKLAYGERGYPGAIPGRTDLVFEMELLSITRGAKPLPVPDFVMPGASELTTTASGLQYKVIKEGEGDPPAGPTARVTVHYAGWLTDGTSFDNSFKRGEPTAFGLNQVIPGWTEGVQLMKPGAVYVFVIPHNLAYGPAGRPPTIPPSATLVFHIELLEIGG